MSKDNSGESFPKSSSGNNGNNSWRKGYIQGNTFSNKEVDFRINNGRAIFEGDIVLARNPQEIERLSHKLVKGVGIRGDHFRWPRGEIPYTIESTLPHQDRVTDAIKHFEDTTPIRFFTLIEGNTSESNVSYFPNHVTFRHVEPQFDKDGKPLPGVCESAVGMQGGEQFVNISGPNECPTDTLIHEIGHVVGLWHEQSRKDRSDADGKPVYLEVLWDNIIDGKLPDGSYDQNQDMRHNFEQHVTDGDDIGEYDYCSIMHYSLDAFSKNGQPTLRVVQTNFPCGRDSDIGWKKELSAGDKAAVIHMYGNVIPGVGRNEDGRLEVFSIGSDRRLYHKWQTEKNNSTKWSDGWTPLGGNWRVGANPVVAENADGRLEVFSIGSDRRLYHKWQTEKNNSTKWSEAPLAEYSQHFGDPSIGRDANGNLEVFTILGGDFMVYRRKQTTPGSNIWSTFTSGNYSSDWQPLGARCSPMRRPTVANNANGKVELLVMMQDTRLYSYIEGEDWEWLGGDTWSGSDPVVAQNVDGRLEVFIVGPDKQLHHRWQTAPNSSKWSESSTPSLKGEWSLRRRPAVAQNADGRLEVFIVGLDQQLHHKWQVSPNSNTWSDTWVPLGEKLWPPTSDPGVGRNADGRLEVFMVGSDNQVYHKWQTAPNSTHWSDGPWDQLR